MLRVSAIFFYKICDDMVLLKKKQNQCLFNDNLSIVTKKSERKSICMLGLVE